jgi:glycosyltransferase involved in cell wall biosynthesis
MSTSKVPAPRISIGLPVFNGARYLVEALDSLLCQTFVDFELIISDNASTDATQQIGEDYARKDARVRYFRNSKNLGGAYNDNRVFSLATGEYFKWAAHDDICAPTFLESCLGVLDEDPSIVLSYPKTIIINEEGRETEPYEDSFHFISQKPSERYREILGKKMLLNPVYGLIRAEALRNTHMIENYSSSDRVLLGELSLKGRFFEIPQFLFYRRIHPEKSTSANATVEQLALWHDPKKKFSTLTPKTRRFLGFFRAIWTAEISMADRLACSREFWLFYLNPETIRGRLGGFFRETIQALRTTF